MNRKIRAAVVKRAGESCEACFRWCGEAGHLDHQFGRAKAEETEANCWLLCPTCDHEKTVNYPSAATWLQKFALHASLHGFKEAAERALTKLAVLKVKGLA